MGRSLWKGIDSKLNLFVLRNNKYGKPYYITDRNSIIIKKYENYFFKIYNGFKYIPKIINKDMINHKFGEFSLTTKMGSNIHRHFLKKKKLLKRKK